MAIEYKTPSQVADQYLRVLKGLKPEVNTSQTDSDWYVRSRVLGGTFSGLYADQQKVSNDAFPQSARREAVERHLETYFGTGFREPQLATGQLLVSAASGSSIPALTELVYGPNQNVYQTQEVFNFGTAVTGLVEVVSVATGQDQNLEEGAELTFSAPPAGVESTATVSNGPIGGGRDEETTEEGANRVLARIRAPISGGTQSDYEQWAVEADDRVSSATVKRFAFGFGSVALYITAGTTDIDEAVDNGDPVVRIPSQDIIDAVQDYIESVNPLTDCATVLSPEEVEQDVTVRIAYKDGIEGSTVIEGTDGKTAEELVINQVKKAVYKTPVGGRVISGSGFLLASEIEESIDFGLSDSPYAEGDIAQILVDRQVLDLSVTGANRALAQNQIVSPGIITIIASLVMFLALEQGGVLLLEQGGHLQLEQLVQIEQP